MLDMFSYFGVFWSKIKKFIVAEDLKKRLNSTYIKN